MFTGLCVGREKGHNAIEWHIKGRMSQACLTKVSHGSQCERGSVMSHLQGGSFLQGPLHSQWQPRRLIRGLFRVRIGKGLNN